MGDGPDMGLLPHPTSTSRSVLIVAALSVPGRLSMPSSGSRLTTMG